jgi:hypothetical protein
LFRREERGKGIGEIGGQTREQKKEEKKKREQNLAKKFQREKEERKQKSKKALRSQREKEEGLQITNKEERNVALWKETKAGGSGEEVEARTETGGAKH